MRTYVVGDIHGAAAALRQVLDRSPFDAATDRLISLGDIGDGWPDTIECVEILLQLPHHVGIRGNHDVWLRELLCHRVAHPAWVATFGRATVDAYLQAEKSIFEAHKRFFEHQVPYFIDEDNRLYVHAGYDPRIPLAQQNKLNLRQSRRMWEELLRRQAQGKKFPKDVNGFSEVYIGHSQTIKQVPSAEPQCIWKVWNLDQGVKSSGKLTLMDVESHEYWQSDWIEELYPPAPKGKIK